MEVGVEEERRNHMEVGVEEEECHSRMVVVEVEVEQLGQLVQLELEWLLVRLVVVVESKLEVN